MFRENLKFTRPLKKPLEPLIEEIKFHYLLLNHRHLSELRFLRRGVYPIVRIAKNFEEVLKYVKRWHGQRNIYIGLRDRRKDLKGAARTQDIIGVQTLILDIDPVREHETPSTDDELKRAIDMAELIASWFSKNGFLKPWIAITGNGTALYFAIPWISVTDENAWDISNRIQNFESFMRRKFSRELKKLNLNIDSMYDLPRIVRLIGTLNLKGEPSEERPWRYSLWLYREDSRKEDPKLAEFVFESNL